MKKNEGLSEQVYNYLLSQILYRLQQSLRNRWAAEYYTAQKGRS